MNKSLLLTLILWLPMALAAVLPGSSTPNMVYKQQDYSKDTPLASECRNYLADEEQALYDELFEMTGITAQDWETFKQEQFPAFLAYEAEHKKAVRHTQEIDPKIKSQVHAILKEYGMDHIDIIPSKKWGCTACHTFITVDDEKAAQNNWFRHTILHEMQHLQNHDYFIGYCIAALFNSKSISHEAGTAYLTKFNHFKECRAEMLALCNERQPREHPADHIHNYQQGRYAKATFTATFNHPSAKTLYRRIGDLHALATSQA